MQTRLLVHTAVHLSVRVPPLPYMFRRHTQYCYEYCKEYGSEYYGTEYAREVRSMTGIIGDLSLIVPSHYLVMF